VTVGAFEHDVTTASHPGSTARLGRFRAPVEPRKTASFHGDGYAHIARVRLHDP